MTKTKILMLDTETANSLDYPLAYNIGCAVIDLQGHIYETLSMCIQEVYCDKPELMQSVYYANKIPQYQEQIKAGTVQLVSLAKAVCLVRELCRKYQVKAWCAHNAIFDNRSLNTTQRYITKSKYRYFLPYELEAWDTMLMAQDVICKMPTYRKFCEDNDYICKNGQLRKTAEILYRFIAKDNDFTEEHKALEDVLIEIEILKYCFRQHKKMRKRLWND